MSYTQKPSDAAISVCSDEYTFDMVTVTVEAGMKSGSVLELSAGKYIWVVAANVDNAVAVLSDDRADYDTLTAGDHTLRVASRSALVGRGYLNFSGAVTAGNITDAEAALLTAGIKAVDNV